LESFEQLTKQYTPMIHKIINSLHIYKNRDEFFHYGLIALWEASKRFDPNKGSFTNYAYTYVKGYILSELRRANLYEERSVYPLDEFWETIEATHKDDTLDDDTLLTYCRYLTENQKKWVMYTVLRDLSIKEIAELEGVSMSAVKNWRAGAREKIRGYLRI
jgi:RNA polymerase sigma factor (sigma-70 family)